MEVFLDELTGRTELLMSRHLGGAVTDDDVGDLGAPFGIVLDRPKVIGTASTSGANGLYS